MIYPNKQHSPAAALKKLFHSCLCVERLIFEVLITSILVPISSAPQTSGPPHICFQGLTLYHESSDRRASHPGSRTIGGTNVHTGVLKGDVGDHQISCPEDLDSFHADGSSI